MPTPYARHARRTRTRLTVALWFAAAVLAWMLLWLGVGVLIAFAMTGAFA